MAFISTLTTTPRLSKRARPHRHTCRQPPTASVALSRREALSLLTAAGLTLPVPAHADHTYVAAKRAYDRYHPRIIAAIDTLRNVRSCVTEDDATGAAALIADKVFDIKARRAFSIYATSFSDNYLGERSRSMLKSVEAFYNELAFVGRGEEMSLHYGRAVDKLGEYYREARLPDEEIAGLAI